MRRTLILSALGAITLSIGFGVGATLATTTPVQPSPTTMMDNQDTGHMNGADGMMQMMMGSSAMGGQMPAALIAQCNSAHALMVANSAPTMDDSGTEHSAHHQAVQP